MAAGTELELVKLIKSVIEQGDLNVPLIIDDGNGNVSLFASDGSQYDLVDYPYWLIQVPVAANQNSYVCEGSRAGIGDVLGKIDYVINTPGATATLQIQDGTGNIYTLHPTGGFLVAGPGSVSLGYTAVSGSWRVTTGAGLTAVANLM